MFHKKLRSPSEPVTPVHVVGNVDPLAVFIASKRGVGGRIQQMNCFGTVIDNRVQVINPVVTGISEVLVAFGAGEKPPAAVIE